MIALLHPPQTHTHKTNKETNNNPKKQTNHQNKQNNNNKDTTKQTNKTTAKKNKIYLTKPQQLPLSYNSLFTSNITTSE